MVVQPFTRQFTSLCSSLIEVWVERRAHSIADPVRRLRYLQRLGRQPARKIAWTRRAGVLLFLLLPVLWILPAHQALLRPAPDPSLQPTPSLADMNPGPQPESSIREVWLVERKPGEEVYSNGLRIETSSAVSHTRRSYNSISLQTGQMRTDGVYPAGIVYHTTESHIAAFEADNNQRLQRVGQWVLTYLTRNRSYHYFVDRFGRVHRVVEEQDAADHAGASIWADRERIYLGLNHSFLAVALEGQTEVGDRQALFLTDAQIHSTRVLTEMLRSRYKIPSANCITHAQVSVNRSNLRIGNHTDWASNFPFQRIGLPDNYNLLVPAMVLFGFGYDQDFVEATGERMWRGLAASENQVRRAAAANGLTVAAYRATLQQEFKRRQDELPANDASYPLASAGAVK